ncbi:hypothetical protein GALL_26110 [mine drainage metagenome]|uniref:AAA+ ATPase domain-containing protein n=1 Tax=mine drainage metagenome TaxID=410659 RepID=A0A1J5T7E5_9ZZZZ
MQITPEDAVSANLPRIEAILSSGFSIDRLANETGIQREHVDQLLSRKLTSAYSMWEAKEDAGKLDKWLAEYEQEAAQRPAKTPTFNTITALLAKAHHEGEIVSITGGVGVGKTETCKAYVKEYARGYDRPGAFFVEFTSADKKLTSALESILAAMLGSTTAHSRQSSTLLRVLCGMLKPGDFMILDECNYLVEKDSRTIDAVRDIHNKTGIGIALMGNPDFDKKVYGKNGDFDALASRALRVDFPASTEGDIDCWMQWKGLGTSGKAVRNELVRIGTRPGSMGGLRVLNKLVDNVLKLNQGEPLTPDLIRQFSAQFGRA